MKKVIVIGLDGIEPTIAEAMQQAGELPNLTSLALEGGYARVQTTYPAQTPVAWSTFTTGTNPGGHGIFDFLSRDPLTYLPVLALSRYEQKSAFLPPQVVNLRRGTPFWSLISEAGLPTTVLRCPCTYPPDEIQGRMLAGVGVPDLRGGLGTSTFYTTRKGIVAQHSEKVIQIQTGGRGPIPTHLIGPRNPKTRDDITFDINLHPDPPENRLTIQSGGQPRELLVRQGQWSEWLKVRFKVGLLQGVRGMVRFYLRNLEPELELYASPVNFDPSAPLFPISTPPEYAQELEARLGTFYTTGMVEDHDGLNNLRIDEAAYLDQCQQVMQERENMMLSELDRMEAGFLYCLFDTPDRIQHMFWRFREADHPANAEHGLLPEMKHVIEEQYRACDEMVGRARAYANEDTLLMVLSDHGMNSFQRGLNLNTWLCENGFLSLKPGLTPGEEAGDLLRSVDWSRTRAYSLGLGAIFLNLAGREAEGQVTPDQAADLKTEIKARLTGLIDPDRGQEAVRSVVDREEVFQGPYTSEAPDLLVNFHAGYRVSWSTPLGGVPEGLFEDNRKKWGGDHVIDPALVPGVLYMNQPFQANAGPSLVDMAPTILAALGLAKTPDMEGENLLA